jgi:hypothetical protein
MSDEEKLAKLVAMLKSRIRALSDDLLQESEAGLMEAKDVTKWRDAIAREIAAFHEATAVVGNNGMLSAPLSKAVKNAVKTQLDYLNQFANQVVANGVFDKTARVRADMYAGALRSTFFTAKTKSLPLPAMPCEGTICHTNCQCAWEIVTIDADVGDYDCFWRRSADDSCSTCLARESIWSPLQIRAGEVQ